MSHPFTPSTPLRLHHNPMSSNARRAVVTALHLNLPVELALVVNMMEPTERARLIKLNPNAKIPVLEHGDFVLWESYAIMQYLAQMVPGQTLYPTDLQARVDVDRWMFWCGQHLSSAVGILNWQNMIKPMYGFGEPDADEVKRGEVETRKVAELLDAHLDGRSWMCGEGLTLADIALATPFMNRGPSKMPLDDYVHLQAWLARVESLEAWKKAEHAS